MPAICESIQSKLSENLSQSFKKSEKENLDSHLTPSAKQVLSAKIEYEPFTSYNNLVLSSLQNKYIVLKPNEPALSSNGELYWIIPKRHFAMKRIKVIWRVSHRMCVFVWLHRVRHSKLSSENFFHLHRHFLFRSNTFIACE